eukprot:Skav208164  [mRNA]  locus=scaffold1044:64123:65856:- [translate_table: standard]
MLPIDGIGTTRLLPEFTGAQRLVLLREICGGFQTSEQKAKWDHTVSSNCPWCHASVDDRPHRVFHCAAFDSVREQFAPLLHELEEDFFHLAALPTLRVTGNRYLFQQLLQSFPAPTLQSSVQDQLLGLYVNVQVPFYTDGSCAFPSQPVIRFASYGVVADLAVTDDRRKDEANRFLVTNKLPDTLVPIAAARLSGRQCIHRAEIAAIWWVFVRFPSACVYTDSQDAHDWVERLQLDPFLVIPPLHPDHDLLCQLQQCLRPGHVTVKVKAHQDCCQVRPLLACYHALGNRAVDELVGATNKDLFPAVAAQLWEFADEYLQACERLRTFYKYLLQLAEARDKLPVTGEELQETTVPQPHRILDQLRGYDAGGDWTCPRTLCEDWLSYSAWGLHSTPGPVPLGITWVEISLAVILHLGMWLPVLRKQSDGATYVVQPTSHQHALMIGTCIGEQSWIMSQIFSHFQALTPERVIPTVQRGKVLSLTAYGFNLKLGGLSLRPSFSKQGEVIDILKRYVPDTVSFEGISKKIPAGLGGLPDGVVASGFQLWEEDRIRFQTDFDTMKRASSKATTAVLRRRQVM